MLCRSTAFEGRELCRTNCVTVTRPDTPGISDHAPGDHNFCQCRPGALRLECARALTMLLADFTRHRRRSSNMTDAESAKSHQFDAEMGAGGRLGGWTPRE